jgi:hypothetical protein
MLRSKRRPHGRAWAVRDGYDFCAGIVPENAHFLVPFGIMLTWLKIGNAD